ncbi:DUF5615 family PIN-like protein [Pirellulimonas nuda]|uniref:DUF5615 family PIN-like protein n=1 Tax=Pirellulimonas nuda TaxID=2528009 RepID=UPI0018D2E4D3|nr:DUF5615 family PIN-like protein [Pirellulimonas nuda]
MDESADFRIATGLRRRERDCTTSADEGLLSESDETQFAFSVQQGRVLITRDHDFRELASAVIDHPGVVFCKRRSHFGAIVKELDGMASSMRASDFRGKLFYV